MKTPLFHCCESLLATFSPKVIKQCLPIDEHTRHNKTVVERFFDLHTQTTAPATKYTSERTFNKGSF